MGRPFIDLTGQRFTKLVVVTRLQEKQGSCKSYSYLCKCDCGVETTVISDNLKRGNVQSCGCLLGNPLEEKDKKESTKFYQWKTKVKKRDKHTCLRCKTKGRTLDAHHIVYDDRKNLIHDISRGATLCRFCHLQFHYYYKNINFGFEEFEYFLKSYSTGSSVVTEAGAVEAGAVET